MKNPILILFALLLVSATAMNPSKTHKSMEKNHLGVLKFLNNYKSYKIDIGVGKEIYQISKVSLVGDKLIIHYSDYNDGYEEGTIDSKGNFSGIFKTDVSEGSVKMKFNEDGTATGAWLLNDEWMNFYHTDKSVYKMGYGPNNISKN